MVKFEPSPSMILQQILDDFREENGSYVMSVPLGIKWAQEYLERGGLPLTRKLPEEPKHKSIDRERLAYRHFEMASISGCGAADTWHELAREFGCPIHDLMSELGLYEREHGQWDITKETAYRRRVH